MCLDDLDNYLDWDDPDEIDGWLDEQYAEDMRALDEEDERLRAETPFYYQWCEHYQMSPGGA
jgi:hypothetical protein